MKKSKILLFFLMLSFVVILQNIQIRVIRYYDKKERLNQAEIHTNYIKVMDLYGLPGYPAYSDFIKDDKSFHKMKKLYADFEKSSFRYLEFFDGMIQLTDYFYGNERFIQGEPQQEFMNQEYMAEGEKAFYSNVKAAVIGEDMLEASGITADYVYGECFLADDFNLKEKNIRVILGNKYKDIFRLNQTFQALYLGEECTFRVIGFLDSDFKLNIGNVDINLDYYVLLPGFHVEDRIYEASSNSDKQFYNMHYVKKTEGLVYIPDIKEVTAIRNILEKMYVKRNLKFSAIPIGCEFMPIRFPYYLLYNLPLWCCVLLTVLGGTLYGKWMISLGCGQVIKLLLSIMLPALIVSFLMFYNVYSQRLVIYNTCIWGVESILLVVTKIIYQNPRNIRAVFRIF